MNAPIVISGTVNAFNTSCEWVPNDELLNRAEKVLAGECDPALVLNAMHFTPSQMKGIDGWSLVGSAEVTVTFFPREQMVTEELKALQAQLDHARAEWLTKQQAILDRINKLQALEMTVEA
jgi:hypothetical protein